jgi:cytidylate kinase
VKNVLPKIEVLSLPGCPHAEATLLMARAVARAVVPGAEVRDVRLTEAAARERDFAGSPTLLVDGRDIEGRGTPAAGVA